MEAPNIFILVGGLGTRLKSVIKNVPKPMATIINKPFLDYLIHHIRQYLPNQKIYLLSHYLSEYIEEYYSNDSSIRVVKEKEKLGTGGAVSHALDVLNINKGRLLVFNGDTYHKVQLNKFIKNNEDGCLTVAAAYVKDCSRYGLLDIHNNRLKGFFEKQADYVPGFINAGCYCFHSLKLISKKKHCHFSLEDVISDWLEEGLSINVFPYNGPFIDIGIPSDYQKMIDFARTLDL